ncbi:patatin-like phospholipase family protein [Hymenobacter arizonensis]|uniref:NTE family protein n=1 Tax=Hymenobacter arizonensis TaxID=1227077 RepID=A0A1I5UIN6_HYMAR|nr:patatin-like phospholipase family protein [Hymenobacter arizonensis]SFP95078.1 NTE family protein [Hymenobacter arizonensis]
MKKNLLFLLLSLLLIGPWSARAQSSARPRIGLTLSGGGARGLAHIGLLKALDSAQVHVDYVTGTSMGAIVGSLYAAGYSGAEIERVAGQLDWDALLTNAAQLRTVTLPEKDDFGRYLVELPFVKGKFQLATGVIESEELWLKLSELFFPYYKTKDFRRFEREFRCVATDVISGEPVVLREGEIVAAIRASMAIPSFFTPVQYNGRRLVDGGIVRNFPVSEVKAMGAGVVIGSNVSAGAYTDANLRSPVDVLLQISSFKDNADFIVQKQLCTVYVDYPLGDYSSGSFSAAAPITRLGLTQGRAVFPHLKALNDSLDVRYGRRPAAPPAPRADSVYVAEYQVRGLEPALVPALVQQMQFRPNQYYTAPQLSTAIRNAFGTRTFRKITYSLQSLSDSTARVVFDVERSPRTRVGLGLHYNSFTGIGLITSVAAQDLLLPHSTSQAAVNIGENPRLRLKHTQYLGASRTVVARLLAQGERVSITTYTPRFAKAGLYTQSYLVANAQLLKLLGRNRGMGLGTRYEYGRFNPEITSRLQIDGRLRLLNSYLLFEENTLNAVAYPSSGRRVEAEAGAVYNQRAAFEVLQGDVVVGTEASPDFSFRPYGRYRLNVEQYLPLTKRATLLLQLQAGVNQRYRQAIANDFVVGGLSSVIRNQLTFAGLPEASLFVSSAAAGLVGYQYALTPRIYLTGKANALYHGFLDGNTNIQPAGVIYGGALTVGINSFLGPIDTSVMYSNVSKKLLPYFNIGFPFGYR